MHGGPDKVVSIKVRLFEESFKRRGLYVCILCIMHAEVINEIKRHLFLKLIRNKHTPSESTSNFSSISIASFKQWLQNPSPPFTRANSASQRQIPHTPFGQQKQWNFAVLWHMKQECQSEMLKKGKQIKIKIGRHLWGE